jgi:hypothetical protein
MSLVSRGSSWAVTLQVQQVRRTGHQCGRFDACSDSLGVSSNDSNCKNNGQGSMIQNGEAAVPAFLSSCFAMPAV